MLTLQQLYNLGESESVNIFEYLSLPNNSPFDKDTIINTILIKCGLNIPMYADPFTMRSAIDIWSKKNQYTFEHIAKIYTAEYSPIENTDKYDSITVERNRALDDNTAIKNTKTDDLDTSSTTTNTGTSAHTGTDTNTVEETTSAENVSDYQPNDKTTSTMVHGETITDNNNSTTTGESDRKTDINGTTTKDVNEDETTTTTQHTHGNIGVTTNTTLQVEEYKLMADYNPYDFIAGLFENELTLCVY
jgi:hypothetical protein